MIFVADKPLLSEKNEKQTKMLTQKQYGRPHKLYREYRFFHLWEERDRQSDVCVNSATETKSARVFGQEEGKIEVNRPY
jgi:hypothetical protein